MRGTHFVKRGHSIAKTFLQTSVMDKYGHGRKKETGRSWENSFERQRVLGVVDVVSAATSSVSNSHPICCADPSPDRGLLGFQPNFGVRPLRRALDRFCVKGPFFAVTIGSTLQPSNYCEINRSLPD